MSKKNILLSLFVVFFSAAQAQMIGLRELGGSPKQEEINQQNKERLDYYSKLMIDLKKGKIREEPNQPDRILNLYNSYAWYQLLNGDFKGAEKTLSAGMKINPNFAYFPTNLAPALLFQGKFEAAKKIYMEYKDKDFQGKKYSEIYLTDLQEIKATGFSPLTYEEDMKKIIGLLK